MSTTTMPQGVEQQPTSATRGDFGNMDLSRIAQDLQIRKVQVEAVVQLLDEGNTIPFITRYRKERTGGLDEEVLRTIQERIAGLRHMAERKQTILRTIEGQGKLTDELRAAIFNADNPKRLEDLYLPYKPKKKSLATAARDRGLEALALKIWEADEVVSNLDEVLPTLINPEQQLNTIEDIMAGTGHIIAEMIAEAADVRSIVRMVLWDTGRLTTGKSDKLAEGQGLEYKDYFQFTEPIRQIPPHRILAINRGEKDNALTAKLEWEFEIGRRVALERLPLPRKTPPAQVEPAPEGEEAQQGAPPQGGRAPRGQVPFVSRLEDLQNHPHGAFIEKCADDALARLLVPSLEREIRRELTQRSENHAVVVFARNLRSKLLAAPLQNRRILAIDPAFRTGCKLAALDETGNLIGDGVIFPHAPQNKRAEAKVRLEAMVRRLQIQVIAIGNGTACRETEEVVSELIADLEARRLNPDAVPTEAPVPAEHSAPVEHPAPEEATAQVETPPEQHAAPVVEAPPAEAPAHVEGEPVHEIATGEAAPAEAAPVAEVAPPAPPVPQEPLPEAVPELAYVIVNEAGASVYSASIVGREEFPNFDATLRGTISIGRRLQDPLAELVKIDPQHVGVGLYQHDVNPKHLRESLDAVIESCVNTVGVDLNTASVPLLRHVSGMNALTAQNVVEFRKQNGPFRSREQLLQVPGIGEGRYIQAAGFLKITGGDEPLDGTWIHPESYPTARQLLSEIGADPATLSHKDEAHVLHEKINSIHPEEVASRLQIGIPTLADILDALARPGRDPREDLPPPPFKKGILKLEDLQPGMELKGTVLNVVDFGAFVDIGLKDSGLVHISQMANRYVKSPYDVASVGDVVGVWVIAVDGQRHRVSLTMIQPGSERRPPERRSAPPQRREGNRPPREGQAPREGQPPREGQAPRPEGQQPQGDRAPRGDRPPREGGRPPAGGNRPPRGDNRGGQGQGGPGGKRSALPPRGMTRSGTGGGRPQQGGRRPEPGQGGEQGAPAEGQTPAAGQKQGKRDKPTTRLSQAALTGKEPLNSFSQLAALLASRSTPPEKAETPPPAEHQESPPPA